MRRLLLTSLLLLVLTTTAAAASSGRVGGSSATGPISALTRTAITVGGDRSLSCRLTLDSPKLLGFTRGERVGISCKAGVLTKIARVPKTTSTTGTVVALRDGSISVDGKRDVTCRLGDLSPELKGLEVGDRIELACKAGVLVRVHDVKPAPPAVSETYGELSALGAASLTVVDGEHSLTCRFGADSPATTGYRVGDRVKVRCSNGVVTVIAKKEAPTRHEEEKPAAPPAPAEEPKSDAKPVTQTETKPSYVYAVGAIVTLSPTSIAVRGEKELGCSLGAGSPKLGDYKVGDKVKLQCLNGFVTAIARDVAVVETKSAPVYGQGAIVTLATTSITVRADKDFSCVVGAESPRLGDYRLGDKVKLQCFNGTLTAIARA